ncbi:MAG TPA: hypothetical protein VM243_13370 [Phycisphaerae bacterium]|nr:hypothetical protein [Phycisphaerae bacterium]
MRKLVATAVVFCVALGLWAGPAFPRAKDRTAGVPIAIAPSTLILGRTQGGFVTVHAAIPYGQVDPGTLALDGVPVAWTKADNRGELVANFVETEVKAIVEPPDATLTLTGLTIDGQPFSGSDTVRVIIDPAGD